MKYEVKTKFVFDGIFTVEAENEIHAKNLVNENCGLVMGGGIHTTLAEEDCNWNFDSHPNKIIGKASELKSANFEKRNIKSKRNDYEMGR